MSLMSDKFWKVAILFALDDEISHQLQRSFAGVVYASIVVSELGEFAASVFEGRTNLTENVINGDQGVCASKGVCVFVLVFG